MQPFHISLASIPFLALFSLTSAAPAPVELSYFPPVPTATYSTVSTSPPASPTIANANLEARSAAASMVRIDRSKASALAAATGTPTDPNPRRAAKRANPMSHLMTDQQYAELLKTMAERQGVGKKPVKFCYEASVGVDGKNEIKEMMTEEEYRQLEETMAERKGKGEKLVKVCFEAMVGEDEVEEA
jgi:hypothetical protein